MTFRCLLRNFGLGYLAKDIVRKGTGEASEQAVLRWNRVVNVFPGRLRRPTPDMLALGSQIAGLDLLQANL